MDGNITITKDEYVGLKISEERLSRLENGGVDNWIGYDESLNCKGKQCINEWEKEERKRIENL